MKTTSSATPPHPLKDKGGVAQARQVEDHPPWGRVVLPSLPVACAPDHRAGGWRLVQSSSCWCKAT